MPLLYYWEFVMVFWNGKPISALDSSHIERILSAARRGVWANGKPCNVRPETVEALRVELRSRGAGDFVPEKPTEDPPPELFGPPPPPPAYDAQLAAMGYEPPPPPIAVPEPWSPPIKAKPALFPSLAQAPDEPKGARLVSKLERELEEAQRDLRKAEARAKMMTRAAERARERLEEFKQTERREEQTDARRLRAMNRRAGSADLLDVEERELLEWWEEELKGCGGALVDGLKRVIRVAYRGLEVKDLVPRRKVRVKRPGIQKD